MIGSVFPLPNTALWLAHGRLHVSSIQTEIIKNLPIDFLSAKSVISLTAPYCFLRVRAQPYRLFLVLRTRSVICEV